MMSSHIRIRLRCDSGTVTDCYLLPWGLLQRFKPEISTNPAPRQIKTPSRSEPSHRRICLGKSRSFSRSQSFWGINHFDPKLVALRSCPTHKKPARPVFPGSFSLPRPGTILEGSIPGMRSICQDAYPYLRVQKDQNCTVILGDWSVSIYLDVQGYEHEGLDHQTREPPISCCIHFLCESKKHPQSKASKHHSIRITPQRWEGTCFRWRIWDHPQLQTQSQSFHPFPNPKSTVIPSPNQNHLRSSCLRPSLLYLSMSIEALKLELTRWLWPDLQNVLLCTFQPSNFECNSIFSHLPTSVPEPSRTIRVSNPPPTLCWAAASSWSSLPSQHSLLPSLRRQKRSRSHRRTSAQGVHHRSRHLTGEIDTTWSADVVFFFPRTSRE